MSTSIKYVQLEFEYIYKVLLWILATPACRWPLLSRLRPCTPTERGNPVAAFGSTPKSSYGCVFNHTTTLSMLCPRTTGSIAELSIYLIIRADRLPRGCTSTEPARKRAALSSSFRLRLPSSLLSPSPVGPDYFIGVKNQLILRTQLWQFNGGRDATSRWIFKQWGHLFVHAHMQARQWMGVGDKTRARKPTAVIYLLHTCTYNNSTYGKGATDFHAKTPEKKGRTGPVSL